MAIITGLSGNEIFCLRKQSLSPGDLVIGKLMGALRSLARGEIQEFSQIFNTTRHLALKRIRAEARAAGANAVVGIKTSILPFGGMQEMVMIGTASEHPTLPAAYRQNPVTSDVTNEEMWNLIQQGYMQVHQLCRLCRSPRRAVQFLPLFCHPAHACLSPDRNRWVVKSASRAKRLLYG